MVGYDGNSKNLSRKTPKNALVFKPNSQINTDWHTHPDGQRGDNGRIESQTDEDAKEGSLDLRERYRPSRFIILIGGYNHHEY